MGNFNLPFGVRLSNSNVLDASRYVVGDIAARDFIITDERAYVGLQTFVESEKKLYILKRIYTLCDLRDSVVNRNIQSLRNRLDNRGKNNSFSSRPHI